MQHGEKLAPVAAVVSALSSMACCLRNNVLWDLAALYPPAVEWKDALPPAIFFNGPVEKRKTELETALNILDLPARNSSRAAFHQ